MSETKQNIVISSHEESVLASKGTSSTQIEITETNQTIHIVRPANHNEISIMESDWNQIKYKINSIQLKKHLDISSLLIGVFIPYIIDLIGSYAKDESPDYLPVIICTLLYVLFHFLSKKIPFLGEDVTSENIIHLSDVKSLIKQISTGINHKDN